MKHLKVYPTWSTTQCYREDLYVALSYCSKRASNINYYQSGLGQRRVVEPRNPRQFQPLLQ